MSHAESTRQRANYGAIRRLARGRRGQVMIMTVLVFPVLLGFMGLALDLGFLYHVRRRMQTAADAGALGGAHELWRLNSSLVTSAANNDASLNGFSASNAVVTVNNPPSSGSRAGDAKFVEVIISQDAPTFFMRVVNRQSATVRARAVAGLVNHADGCVMALDPTERGALTVQGTATLTANCGIMVNSTDDRAIIANGGACIYAGQVGVTGNYVANGSANCIYPEPVADVPPALDPLAYLTPPAIPPSVISVSKITGGTVTLNPGRYLNGIKITGGTVTFTSGTYILDGGGLDVSGNAVLIGNGVTFYNTNTGAVGKWGTFGIAGTVRTELSAPDSGPYEGILFWNDQNSPDKPPGNVIAGTSDSKLEGALYFPTTHVTYTGTSTTAAWTMIIADTITVSGNTVVQSDFASSPIAPPTRVATLVE